MGGGEQPSGEGGGIRLELGPGPVAAEARRKGSLGSWGDSPLGSPEQQGCPCSNSPSHQLSHGGGCVDTERGCRPQPERPLCRDGEADGLTWLGEPGMNWVLRVSGHTAG